MKLPIIVIIICFVCLHAHAQADCPVPRPAANYTGHLQPGQLLEHPVPPYPERVKSHGISGTLVFRAHILEDGTVGHLTPISGPPELQEPVEKTIYHWRYTSWTVNGQPVDAFKYITMNFNLNPALGSAQKPTGLKVSPSTLQTLLVRSYPAKRSKEAEKANIFGTVQLHIIVDDKGRIADLGVVCGSEALDDAALETVRHWIYQPYLNNGHTVAVESTVDVKF